MQLSCRERGVCCAVQEKAMTRWRTFQEKYGVVQPSMSGVVPSGFSVSPANLVNRSAISAYFRWGPLRSYLVPCWKSIHWT